MIAIVNYGLANLRSVQKALQRVGANDAQIIDRPDTIDRADKLILPGVGAFVDAIGNLRRGGFVEPILRFIESGKPLLGICLGLQMLFDVSEEDGEHQGLGVIRGRIVRFQPDDPTLKVPHMGWNALTFNGSTPRSPLLEGLTPGDQVYFVHSYYAAPVDASVVATTTDYGGPFCSSIFRDNLMATQFHPEKSQRVGLKMLANFAAL